MSQKIMIIIFLIPTICNRVSFLKYAFTFHQYHKNYCEKKVIPNALIVFNGTFKIEKSNLLKQPLVWKVSPNYVSQTLSSPNVSEDINVTLLPKREVFFLTCPPEKSQMLYLFISKVISNFCEIISQFLCCQCIVKFLKKFLSKQPQEVIFSRKTVKISHLSFTFNTVPVAHTTCQDEHLGLYLDKKLSFSDHINGKV